MQNDLTANENNGKLTRAQRREQAKALPPLYPGVQSALLKFPMFIAIPIIYLVLGKFLKLWHPAWLLFLVLPFYYQLCHAFGAKTERSFLLRLPVVPGVLIVFLCAGLFLKLWSFAWLLFLAIPMYYWVVAFKSK